MKKVLVTGAGGSIGTWVLKYLLSEGKYEITALDIKSKETMKRLKKYNKRVNVLYGNLEDNNLVDTLIKEHDYVIHLAGMCPPLCNLSRAIGMETDFLSTETIVKSISFYHPECFLIYPSTTTVYSKSTKEITTKDNIKINANDYYSEIKLKCENQIQDKLKNYVIFRFPFVLGDFKRDFSIFMYDINENIETISERDAAYLLVKAIENASSLQGKLKIASGGKSCRISMRDFLIKFYDFYGFSGTIFWKRFSNPYRYSGNYFKEDQKLDTMLNYKNDSIDAYFSRYFRNIPKSKIRHLIAIPLKKSLERRKSK